MDFSIIIPAKNEEVNIRRCLASIRAIDYPQDQYEVIVVDNGSIDGTIKIAEEFNIQSYIKPGITIAALRNFGASMASGTILVFLDADCSVKHDWFKEASRYLHSDDVVCFGSAPVIPESATWVQSTWFNVCYRGASAMNTRWLGSTNMFIKKEAFVKIGGFDEALVTCEDVDISYRLDKIGRIVFDPALRSIHHREPATISEFFSKEKWRGKSNYKGLFRHGLKTGEIPSLVLPIYYGFFCVFLIFSLFFFFEFKMFVSSLLLWQTPLIIMTMYKLKDSEMDFKSYLQLHFLYNIYFAARFTSLFC